MKLTVNPKYKYLEPFLQELPAVFDRTGEVLYEERNVLRRYHAQGTCLVVKRFKRPHLVNRFVYAWFRESKARRSYEYGMELLRRGVCTPEPVAYIENRCCGLTDSYYISLDAGLPRVVREFWTTPEIGERAFILDAFARFTADMHKKGVLHLDYSAGNILFDVKDGLPVFSLVDINRVSLGKPVSEEDGYRNFRRLWFPHDTYVLLARAYAAACGYDEAHAVERICYYKDEFMKHRK